MHIGSLGSKRRLSLCNFLKTPGAKEFVERILVKIQGRAAMEIWAQAGRQQSKFRGKGDRQEYTMVPIDVKSLLPACGDKAFLVFAKAVKNSQLQQDYSHNGG